MTLLHFHCNFLLDSSTSDLIFPFCEGMTEKREVPKNRGPKVRTLIISSIVYWLSCILATLFWTCKDLLVALLAFLVASSFFSLSCWPLLLLLLLLRLERTVSFVMMLLLLTSFLVDLPLFHLSSLACVYTFKERIHEKNTYCVLTITFSSWPTLTVDHFLSRLQPSLKKEEYSSAALGLAFLCLFSPMKLIEV